MRYSMAGASMAHTYGNVTAFIKQWLIDLFPQGYFKTEYVNSTIAYRDFTQYNNSKKEFIKKNKPMLLIRPRIDINAMDELPMNQTYLAQRIYDSMSEDIETGNMQNFFWDKDNNRQIQFLINALKISFDVTIMTETLMEQINMVHYFRNRVRQEWEMSMMVDLESFISRDIMYILAKDSGYADVFEGNPDRLGEFLQYVNNNSFYPVTVKYKNSSGRHEFFRYHPSHLNVSITNLNIDEGRKKNQIIDDFSITFTVNADFQTAGLYTYLSENDKVFDEVISSGDTLTGGNIIPIITPQQNYVNRTLPNGWQIFTVPAFEIDTDEVPYPLDFSVLMNTSLKEAIKYHKDNGVPLTTFMHIDVTKNGRTMEIERGEYKIDWDNLTIYVYNCNIIQEYRLILSVNTVYLNDLLADIVDFKNEK